MGSGEGCGGESEARMEGAVDQILAAAEAGQPAGAAQPPGDPPAGVAAPEVKTEPPSATGDLPSLDPNEWSNDGRSTGDDSGAHRGGYGPGYPQGSAGGADGSGGLGGGADGAARKRTPRQQEQNKHAQQRYRARRKAQFEELQDSVAVLVAQLKSSEAERQALRSELARAKAAAAAAPAAAVAPSPPAAALGLDPAALAAAPEPVQALIRALQAQGGVPAAAPATPAAPAAPAQPPAAQVQEMVRAFGQEVWRIMSSQSLLRGASAAVAGTGPQAIALIKMGLELASMVLNASGSDAEVLLHDGATPGLPCAADDPQRWQTAAAAVALTPQQVAQVALWRAQLLSKLDACYGERVALKTKGLQALNAGADAPPAGGTQWAETLLLSASGSTGSALAAQADAELQATAEALLKNVASNRAATLAALSELLTSILTPPQAIRYLATSHPFMWNGLAFAHAATSGVTGGP